VNCKIKYIFETFEDISKVTRPIEKLRLLEKISKCEEFEFIAKIVYDRNIKTYVSYDVLERYPCGSRQIVSFNDFKELVGLLINRKIVGKQKDISIQRFLASCDEFHCKWYKRILSKDLRIGVGPALIKQALNITDKDLGLHVSPMLATEITTINNIDEFLHKYEWCYECKIDGLRVITVFADGTYRCYSRNIESQDILIKEPSCSGHEIK